MKEAAVLAPAGIVGQVFLIIEGTLGEGCGLKFVKRTEDLQTGDVIVTSGVDGIFPRGLPIGRITSVDKRGQGLFSSRKDGAGVEASRARKALVGLLACGRGLPLGSTSTAPCSNSVTPPPRCISASSSRDDGTRPRRFAVSRSRQQADGPAPSSKPSSADS